MPRKKPTPPVAEYVPSLLTNLTFREETIGRYELALQQEFQQLRNAGVTPMMARARVVARVERDVKMGHRLDAAVKSPDGAPLLEYLEVFGVGQLDEANQAAMVERTRIYKDICVSILVARQGADHFTGFVSLLGPQKKPQSADQGLV